MLSNDYVDLIFLDSFDVHDELADMDNPIMSKLKLNLNLTHQGRNNACDNELLT